ncbi:DUF7147 family protein [Halalkalibacter hemicellulosilyticus]|uniref:DUF7147 domain-containing protein n=1 Tax=Halalkalibacter hemicellulosilyticusJCM 9152 TaxID=1236971 RepID=W4QAY2_9BACI|nr:hypothetical protein [Halalkalibacter hemicellulosilyticus]GAE29127.1 hypothetical protein JCM9152_468 [Halalkalibacter hemicellulosilyticusJCM 9152]
MIQRFIKLGEGYNDLYELLELARTNTERIHMLLQLDTTIAERPMSSVVLILQPASPGKMMPLYICLEGILNPSYKETERYHLIKKLCEELEINIHRLEVKPSHTFSEEVLYFQYLIGVLRMNKYIPPLQ